MESIPAMKDGCFKTKGCIAPVDSCIKNDSCDVMMTHRKEADYYVFELLAKLDGQSSDGFVAMGLSKDRRMVVILLTSQFSLNPTTHKLLLNYEQGDDLIVECVRRGCTNHGMTTTRIIVFQYVLAMYMIIYYFLSNTLGF